MYTTIHGFIHHKLGTDKYEILLEFPILHSGWEMDNIGWIIQANGKRSVLTTRHGSPYLMSLHEAEEKIAEYNKAIDGMRAAIGALKD